jgi:uncharacterized protein YhaN
MRISRLDLTRYGCFTNQSIAFRDRQSGKPDLHIIYGRNEAGKSTLLNAYMDLLFGIGAQSPFSFLHSYSTMRIGALLEFADGEQEIVRIKRPQGSLLDQAERPIGDGVIQRELGGLDRERYRTMFSLDDAYLQEGGQNILASKGDLGVLLFSASAGLADLGQQLNGVKAATEAFYKFHAKKGELRELKAWLDEIRAQRAELDTQASVYAELTKTQNRLQMEYEAAVEEEGRTTARITEIDRLLLALPEAAELNRFQDQLSALRSLPKVPASWVSDLDRLKQEEAVLAAEESRIERALARVNDEIRELAVDEVALRVQAEMGRFGELRSRSVGAALDLPAKREERIARMGKIDGILARLERAGEENPERLVLSVSHSGALRRLIEWWSGVTRKQETATAEREKAETALAKTKAAVLRPDEAPETAAPSESAIASVSDLLREASTVDFVRRASLAQHVLNTACSKLNQQLKLLSPWEGSIEELLAMDCPSIEQVQKRKALLSEAAEEVSLRKGEYDRLEQQRGDIELQLGAISATTGILSDLDIQRIREERDAAWSLHKQDLEAESAQVFEAAQQRHDEAVDNRVAHLSDVERHRHLQEQLAYFAASQDAARQERDAALEAHQQKSSHTAENIANLSPSLASFRTDLAHLETWLSGRERALESWEAVVAAEQAKTDADVEMTDMTVRLADALSETGQQVPQGGAIKELMVIARQVVGEFAERREKRKKISELETNLAVRRDDEASAQKEVDEWNSRWAAACRNCWIGESAIPSIDAVREILSELPGLQTDLNELKNIDRRIRGMETDEEDLLDESRRLAAALGIAGAGTASDVAVRVETYIQSVQSTVSALDRKKQELADYETEQSDLAIRRGQHTASRSEMAKVLGVDSLAEIELKLAEIKDRDHLAKKVADQQASLMRILARSSLAEAEAVLGSALQGDLEAEHARLKGMLPDQRTRARDLYADFCKAKDRVSSVGADARIAELEEQKRTSLLEINERAEEYLRLRAGVLAAEFALQAYRERHRSTMLQRASDTFRRICSDRYTGLETQPNGPTETLVARFARGGSRTDNELSDGARRQLYFSLRIAGYYEFVRNHASLPFLADDILESFDNPRAGETFRLLAEMSELGQVIYLTHHEHLCEIAKEVCPSVNIYSLEQAALETDAS